MRQKQSLFSAGLVVLIYFEKFILIQIWIHFIVKNRRFNLFFLQLIKKFSL